MSTDKYKPVVLCIMDGWGVGDGGEFDAIASADTPNWDRISQNNPKCHLKTYGLDVGLPEGQMGNSEVGHMNIGAGRVVMQFLPRIAKAFANDDVKELEAFKALISSLNESGGACHLMGLISDGGVHAHIDHVVNLAKTLAAFEIRTYIHVFTDGRDTPPKSGKAFVENLQNKIEALKGVTIATLSGRYYAMDRDKRWERTEAAYNTIVKAEGRTFANAAQIVGSNYDDDTYDEFVVPATCAGYEGMKDGDAILFANFRGDRARQILNAFLDEEFDGFNRGEPISFSKAVGMVEYSDDLNQKMATLFPPQKYENIFGKVLSENGLKQLRMAETEKYPHVTFFFNGGKEDEFEGEKRIMVASPKVATYDLQPEMSAPELTEKLLAAIKTNEFDAVIINYANPDMVGHTGDIIAARKAVETVDNAIGQINELLLEKGGALILTADHGNADKMYDENTDGPHTAHTLNLVPFVVSGAGDITLKDGCLADIAPTMLELLGVKKPEEMTGESLIS